MTVFYISVPQTSALSRNLNIRVLDFFSRREQKSTGDLSVLGIKFTN